MSLEPPGPPLWSVDWSPLRSGYPWVERLHQTRQDPVFHAEGDVGIHTEQALWELVGLDGWRALPDDERRIVWLATLLHDVAKPDTTRIEQRTEGERVTSRGHTLRGSILARQILWRMGEPLATREAVCALVRHHHVPFLPIDQPQAEGRAIRLSQVVRCDWLTLVAEADARGRETAERQQIVDATELFRLQCAELGCLTQPWLFPSAHARFLCGRDLARSPWAPAPPDPPFEVIVMSGLPASGKDRWLRENAPGLPVVSLDRLRTELDIAPSDAQGAVIQAAREEARRHLRVKRAFAWNATNLSRVLRDQVVGLCADYGASVRIVYREASEDQLAERNGGRDDRVPAAVMKRMLARWEVPTVMEAHQLDLPASSPSGPELPA